MMIDINEVLQDYHKFMSFTKSLEGLRLVVKEHPSGVKQESYECFLKNHHQAADCFYGYSHGSLRLYYNAPQRHVALHINSIDDGYIVFFGPNENLESATRRIELLVNKINSWDGWIPTIEQCWDVEKTCGMYWNR